MRTEAVRPLLKAEIAVTPGAAAITQPVASTVATFGLLERKLVPVCG